MIRMAIVPRLAISSFLNMAGSLFPGAGLAGLDYHQGLPVLDGLAVLAKYLEEFTTNLGLYLVHHLHRLDDAQRLALVYAVALLHEGIGVGRRRAIKRPHHR